MNARPGPLYDVFRASAARWAGAPAFTFLDANLSETRYTYGELFDRCATVASAVRSRRLDETAPVGILLRSQEDQIIHYLAVLSLGLVPAILTPPNRKLNLHYYAETTAAVLNRSQFAAVITDVPEIELNSAAYTPSTLEPLNSATASAGREPVNADRPAGCFLQFSSGTTGIKRGVLVTDDAALRQLDVYSRALELDRVTDVILSWLPLYHDMGFIACLNLPLAYGVHTVMIDPIDWVTDPALFLRAASRYSATLAWNPNFAYAFMAQRVPEAVDTGDLASLRGLVNCSEPVTAWSQDRFLDRFKRSGLRPDAFLGCYAMAETTFALTHGRANESGAVDDLGAYGAAAGHDRVSVGRPLPGVELSVVDASCVSVPERTIGEILVKSPFTFTGYYNDDEATTAAFHEGWYRTGDLGYRVGDFYFVSGRSKDILIVGGVNVFPQDLEDVVSDVVGVLPGRVSAFSDFDPSVQTERVVILAETRCQGEEAAQLALLIRQRILASFQIANFEVQFVPPGWLVKSSSGKMARSASHAKWIECAAA